MPLTTTFVPAPQNVSECGSRIVAYMVGYVALKLMCEQCSSALLADKPHSILFSLIKRKTRGGLQYPSESVIRICHKCESLVRMVLHYKMLASKTFTA